MSITYGTSGSNSLTGTDGDDQLYGGPEGDPTADAGNDTLTGLAGNDTAYGYDGNDVISGGADYDLIYGGAGADSINAGADGEAYGEAGNDTLVGSAGGYWVYLYGGEDNDRITISGAIGGYSDGGTGADSLQGGSGDDTLIGGGGADSVVGGDGADQLSDDVSYGGYWGSGYSTPTGNDTLLGGSGADSLYSSGGADTIDGGSDNDLLAVDFGSMAGPVNFQPGSYATATSFGSGLGGVVNVELFQIRGTTLGDTISLLDGNDTIEGNDGADRLSAGAGDDYVSGGEGGDTVFGGAGNDLIYGVNGNDSLDTGADGEAYGGEGDDTLTGSVGTNYLYLAGGTGADRAVITGSLGGYAGGDDGTDTLLGSDGDDQLAGGAQGDSLSGGLGNDALGDENAYYGAGSPTTATDTLLGGSGDDTITSSGGADSIDGGIGNDVAYIDRSLSATALSFAPTAVGTLATLGTGNGAIINVETFYVVGSGLSDVIRGLDANDTLYGGNGNDSMLGGAGADQIHGGEGADTVFGNAGYDYIQGDAGNDSLSAGEDGDAYGGEGADTLVGFVGAGGGVYLRGEAGNDRISLIGSIGGYAEGGQDADTISGSTGDDQLYGGAGADSISAGSGNDLVGDDVWSWGWPYSGPIADNATDTLLGSAGNDLIYSSGGADSIDGGADSDIAYLHRATSANAVVFTPTSTGAIASLGTGNGAVINVEAFAIDGTALADTMGGLAGNDSFSGGDSADSLSGAGGDDQLVGGGGNDSLAGGDGFDQINGGVGNDSISLGADGYAYGEDNNDTLSASATYDGAFALYGGEGNDLLTSSGSFWGWLYGDGGNDTIVSGVASDGMYGGDGADSLTGGDGEEWLYGDGGHDTLDGGNGNDSLWGGTGNDVYIVNAVGDLVDETGATGIDEVRATVSRTLETGVENLVLLGFGGIWGTGNGSNNVITGNSGNNRMFGQVGADTVTGAAGADTVEGGSGNDLLQGGAGNDSIVGNADLDTAIFEGSFASYTITFDAVAGRYTFSRPGEVDVMSNDVERVQFGTGAGAVTVDLRAAPTGTGPQTIVTGQGPSISSIVEAGTNEDGNAATVQVAENTAAGLAVATVSAADLNLPAGDVLSFALVNLDGTPDVTSPFVIVKTGATTAEIRTSGLLDFEATPGVALRVRVTDVHGNQALQTLNVGLIDVNETPVVTTTTLSVDENTQAVGTVAASDPDAVDSIVYSLEPGALDNALFSLDAATGALSFASAAGADFEADASYTVRVRVADAGNPALATVSDITVTVNDVNEAPVLTTTALSVNENSQAVGTVAASDPDAVDSIVYSLEPGALDNALFSLDAATGALSFASAAGANFEVDASYTVRVRVADAANAALGTVSDITISIQDVNEAPVLTTTALSLNENLQAVGTLLATDQDAVPSIVFSLVPGMLDNALFTLNAATGALAFVSAAGGDFEADASFTLRVRVSDAGNASLFSEADVTVTLNDVVELPVPTEGPDLLWGTSAADTIQGLGGNDTILASLGADRLDGGNGIDTVRFTTATRLDRTTPANSAGEAAGDTYVSIERFEGSSGADTLGGNSSTEYFDGRDGNDRLSSSTGDDTLVGGNGADTLAGGSGANLLSGGAGNDSITGSSGADTFVGGLGVDSIATFGDGARDVFLYRSAAEGNDRITSFVSGQDVFQIYRSGFGLEEDFALTTATFAIGAAPTAIGSDPMFLLNTATGQLTFDINGAEADGTFAIAQFLSGVPVRADFELVA
jgi:Ca2+-binding RTX toxin-like protein